MMNNRILTICAAMAAAMTGTSLAHAQGYPASSSQSYSTAPGVYVQGGYQGGAYQGGGYQGGYAANDRRPGEPDFDALDDDDDAPNNPGSTALSSPGPVTSPADPRYGRP